MFPHFVLLLAPNSLIVSEVILQIDITICLMNELLNGTQTIRLWLHWMMLSIGPLRMWNQQRRLLFGYMDLFEHCVNFNLKLFDH